MIYVCSSTRKHEGRSGSKLICTIPLRDPLSTTTNTKISNRVKIQAKENIFPHIFCTSTITYGLHNIAWFGFSVLLKKTVLLLMCWYVGPYKKNT